MSDKKQLLEEGTIRRFMELANIKPLNTLEEAKKGMKPAEKKEEKPAEKKEEKPAAKKGAMGAKEVKESLEEVETYSEETHAGQGGIPHGQNEEMYGEEEAAPEAGGEMGSGDEGGDDVKPAVEALVSALNDLLSKVGQDGLEVDVEEPEAGGEEAGAEGGMMEAKAKKEEGYGMKKESYGKKKMEEKKKAPADKEPMEETLEEEAVAEGLEVEDDEAIVEELVRRVSSRLVAEMKKAKKGMTEDFAGGGTKHAKGAIKKGHGPGSKVFGAKGGKK